VAVFKAAKTKARWRGGEAFFLNIYTAEPMQRVDTIKQGVNAGIVDWMAKEMAMPKDRLLPALGLSAATVNRRASADQPLSSEDSERVLGMARLVGQVQAMVNQSGNPEGFNAAQWVAHWLEEPLDAIGGRKPAELMDTFEGQSIVSNLLARMQSGAYA